MQNPNIPLHIYKKKLALEVGKRVKLARLMANLNRKQMEAKYNINRHTLVSWEKGANFLTETKARELIDIFSKEQVKITLEWLLYGNDSTYNATSLNQNNQHLTNVSTIQRSLESSEEMNYLEEMNYFCNTNPQSITTKITDNCLSPIFNKGDYVGGIKIFDQNLIKLVGTFSIITLEDQQIVARKIFKHHKDNSFTIGSINPLAESQDQIYTVCNIQNAAQITRHWLYGNVNL